MLDGITVLNQIDVCRSVPGWVISALFITFIVTLVLSIIAGGNDYNKTCAISSIISTMSLITFAVTATSDPIIETRYQVTIDESVSMTEFNERYETIRQDGLIYTIKERSKQ